MATRRWLGSSGDLNATANWSGATVPVSNDVVIFPADVSTGPSTDMATLTAVDLDLIIIEPGVTYDIGGSGNHLDISADKVIHNGRGKLYYKDGGGTTDLMIINSDASGVAGAAELTGTAITEVFVVRGGVKLDGSIGAVTTLAVGYNSNFAGDAYVECTAGGGTVTTLLQNGGHVECHTAVTTAYVGGGKLVKDTATITTLQQSGGTVQYDYGGTITTANLIGGHLDLTQTGDDKTLTAVTQWPGAKFDYYTATTTLTTFNNLLKDIASGSRTGVTIPPTV